MPCLFVFFFGRSRPVRGRVRTAAVVDLVRLSRAQVRSPTLACYWQSPDLSMAGGLT